MTKRERLALLDALLHWRAKLVSFGHLPTEGAYRACVERHTYSTWGITPRQLFGGMK